MGRKRIDSKLGYWFFLVLLLICAASIFIVFKPGLIYLDPGQNRDIGRAREYLNIKVGESCNGIEHLEYWGDAVKWGSDFRLNSSQECCKACKSMCSDLECLCDSWVFCGNRESCGPKFGECWLKKQKDTLDPDRRDSGQHVIWTSGLVFGKGVGIVGLETEYGILHIKLLPDCAPHSVSYILELLASQHCSGCHFYRAENRGTFWDAKGNHVENAPFGPPFGLIQGVLEAHGVVFRNIARETCLNIVRGSVAWVDEGPGFFISLANHVEWEKGYTVFGYVLPEDMEIAEKIARLPTEGDTWGDITVRVLKSFVSLRFRRVNMES